MHIVRPVRRDDLKQLFALSSLARAGLTTFPHNQRILKRRIEDSVHDFQRGAARPDGETYFFVMEEIDTGKLVGTCAIIAKIGGYHPSYTYQIKTAHNRSRVLGVKKDIQYLELKKEYNGPTEIGTLFLHPQARTKGLGRMLSLSRFLFLAQHPKMFENFVIAELRGILDKNDHSPFWNAVCKHFFEVEFRKADLMSMEDKTFIAELIPQHPIYIPILPQAAQQAIGQVHKNTEPARRLLEQENFRFIDEIDIFEAGPVVGCRLKNIRTVRDSRMAVVRDIVPAVMRKREYLIARVGQIHEFRVTRGMVIHTQAGITLTRDTARVLNVQKGDRVRIAPLYGKRT